jgi:hypothetical protein
VRFSGVKIRGVYNAIHTLEAYADNSTMRQSFMRMVMEDCVYGRVVAEMESTLRGIYRPKDVYLRLPRVCLI